MADIKKNNSLDPFNPKNPIRISSELYDFSKCRWVMSMLGYRMLFALASGVDKYSFFNELTIRKDDLFKYLGVNKTGQKYQLLADTLKEVRQSGLDLCVVNPSNGKKTWAGISWITEYKFSEESPTVVINVNEKAVPFLSTLKQWAVIQPKVYLKLNTCYQNWLYPMLKLRAALGRWEITIDQIIDQLNLLEKDSYNKKKDRNATMNILRYVIGIEISEQAKKENKLAKAEKREPKQYAWNYTRSKDGKPTGTLYNITSQTDIEVYATVEKNGRSYSKIVFFIKERIESMSKANLQKLEEKIKGEADDDMGGATGRSSRYRYRNEELSLFQNGVEVIPNPANDIDMISINPVYTTEQLLDTFGADSGMSIETIAKLGGFVQRTDGKWQKPEK